MPETSHPRLSQIPVLDIAAYLAAMPGALATAATELRSVLENIGFFYLAGHGVPQQSIDVADAAQCDNGVPTGG